MSYPLTTHLDDIRKWRRGRIEDAKKRRTLGGIARALSSWNADERLIDGGEIVHKYAKRRFNKERRALQDELTALCKNRVIDFLERWFDGIPD